MKRLKSGNAGSLLGNGLIKLLMYLYAVVVIFPMAWSIVSAFKSTREFYADVWALPQTWSFQNFVTAWNTADIGKNVLNSVLIVGASVALTMVLSAMIAYAVARFRFPGGKMVGKLFIMGLFVPLVLGTIPEFLILQKLGLYDKRIGLVLVYTAYSMPLSVFIMMGIYETIPSAFSEAAMLDGCGHFGVFFRVMMPLSKSGLVTISIFNFLWEWNDYIYAMTFLPSAENRTLPVGMIKLTSMAMYQTDWGALFAGLVIVTVPSVIIYAVFQNQLQQGMSSGGIKG